MSVVGQIQDWAIFALSCIVLGVAVYALIHAATQRPDAFVAAGKLTKTKWLAILGVALLLAVASFGGLLLGMILAVVAAGVYLADVKPAIETVLGRARDNRWR